MCVSLQVPGMPAGYATTYTVPAAPHLDFSFVTIRLAGHMVRQQRIKERQAFSL